MSNQKRKVCFVITSFIHYSRNLTVIRALYARNDVELYLVVAGTALLAKYSSRYAHIKELLTKDGIKNVREVHFNLEGDRNIVKAKSIGLGVVELASMYDVLDPDVVVVRGDRFEVLSAVIAASSMNIPIAHIEGGDISGSIDERIRHAITKLSQLHFVTNNDAKQRVLQMGEQPKFVFNYGSPDIEVVKQLGKTKPRSFDLRKIGSGADIALNKKYILVALHPDLNELDRLREYTKILLQSVHELGVQVIWFWPNFDAGAEEIISHELRHFNDVVPEHHIRFVRYLPPEEYLWLLRNASCFVGNSSAGIKECSYLGLPVVNLGNRQQGRLQGRNVLNATFHKQTIIRSIQKQLTAKRFAKTNLYSAKDTGKRIAEKIATTPLSTHKQFRIYPRK